MIPDCLKSVREGTSSQERGSNESVRSLPEPRSGRPSGESITSHYTETPRDSAEIRRDKQARDSYESVRSGVSQGSSAWRSESSTSDHFMELQEVRIVEPPVPIPDAPKAPTGPRLSPFARQMAFRSYREQMGAVSEEPTPASSEADANDRAPVSNSASFVPKPPREPYRSSFERSMSSMPSADSIPEGNDPGSYVVQQALDRAAHAHQKDQAKKRADAKGKASARRPSGERTSTERMSSADTRVSSLHGARGSSIPHRVRISLDQPIAAGGAIESVGATLVRKRRRLPWKLLLAFGIVSCLCLMVAVTTLSIGIYNFTKLRAARAAKTIDALSDELLPKINAIMVATAAQLKRRFM